MDMDMVVEQGDALAARELAGLADLATGLEQPGLNRVGRWQWQIELQSSRADSHSSAIQSATNHLRHCDRRPGPLRLSSSGQQSLQMWTVRLLHEDYRWQSPLLARAPWLVERE